LTVRVSRFQLGGTAHKRQEKEQALARIALACTYTYIYIYKIAARGGESYERRLARRVVLLKPGRRGLRRHIYSCRVWKLFGIS
jgi:hypothetical protein